MKRLSLLFLSLLVSFVLTAQEPLDYFLPPNTRYNPSVSTPEEVLGFQIGEWHLTHDKLVKYMESLARQSERVSVIDMGRSWEQQPLILVAITSPENQRQLEKLRKDHLSQTDPTSSPNSIREDPLVVWLGYSIHGNEPSGGNAAPLVAYYLAASEQDEVLSLLDKTVVLIDPCLNPDGFNRFASWVNSHKSLNNNPDTHSVEFSEIWPGGRSNHYWFDLNRDWLFLQNPESQARIEQFQRWKPHILTDHHEMGSSSTFFFQPGVPERGNPVVPPSNFSLTQKIGIYHARELDQIGSLYFTEEVFDDFYFGKGSAYPDVNGSIGILFEQASSRGHLRNIQTGTLSFAFTIRNQVKVSLSTLKASQGLEKELKYHQVEFFRTAWEEAQKAPVKGYIFGNESDPYRNHLMVDILLRHKIRVEPVRKDVRINNRSFKAGTAYYVPARQIQYRMVRTLFEKVTEFASTTFYDISTWTLPYAMGIPFEPVNESDAREIETDRLMETIPAIDGSLTGAESGVGYLIPCDPYLVHQALYDLLAGGIVVKIGKESFKMYQNNELITFDPGTLFIPVQSQPVSSFELYQLLERMANEYGLEVFSATGGYTLDGPDLGSGQFRLLSEPKILTLTGGSTSSREVGQMWHLLDTRFNIPITLADINEFNSIDLSSYNTLVLGSGSYRELGSTSLEKLRSWVRGGGKIIALSGAARFLSSAGLINLERVETEFTRNTDERRPYNMQSQDQSGWSIPGTIFETVLDTTHPLAYGYHSTFLPVFKRGSGFYRLSQNAYENIAVYTKQPLLSGYINDPQLEAVAGSSAIQRQSIGRGSVILFLDDPLFRGVWAAQHKMVLNALFWGNL